MSCKLNKNLLFSFSDDTIEPLEKIFVEEHLKYCLECQKELKLIKRLDSELSIIHSDIKVPNMLSNLSELIVENSINELNNKNPILKLNNSKQTFNSINSVIIQSCNITNYDPCSRYLKSKLVKSSALIKKPLKNYCKKKLFKLLKVV